MTWFKVDDSFPQHPKVLRIPRSKRVACVGLWTLAGGWCARNLTDGYLDEHMVEELGGAEDQAEELVRVGLWERVEGGYVFHDWADWQPTRARVEERRDAEARRKQEWRDRKRAKSGEDEPVPPGHPPDETSDTGRTDADVRSTRPDPTRPGSPNGDREGSEPNGSGRQRPPQPKLGEDATAQHVVGAWIERQRRRPASGVINQVGKQVKSLLSEAFTAAEINAGLVQMDAKGLHPSTLPSLVSAAANAAVVRPIRPDGSVPAQLTDEQVDDVLGPDGWALPPPPFDPETTPRDQVQAWVQRQAEEHREQRRAAALARLNGART